MRFRIGDIARLTITKAAEGHYYKSGDVVRILTVWEDRSPAYYRVKVIKATRVLHWLPTDSDLRSVHPLEQLADVMREEE